MEEFLNPKKVLEKLKLKKNMVCADFGCGSGGWAIPLAKKVKWVFAIDILEEPLSALRSKAKMERISNLDALKANVEKGTNLSSESCHLVLMTNLLFQVDDIKKVLEEGKRVLKKGGKILIVDWIKDNPLTKEIEWVDFDKIKEVAKELGLILKEEFKTGAFHKALIFEKK
jgi:ubiquinone/menaquinone biosynthesis C-methylase UbiE